MNAASQGDKALAESNAPLAIEHYTRALVELPRAPAYYLQRSKAYLRLKPADGGPNHVAALRDAEIALSLAQSRGKREIILSAQLRRGVSLYQMERYGDAEFIFKAINEKVSSATPSDKSQGLQAAMAGSGSATKKNGYESELPIWMAKLRRKLAEIPEDDKTRSVSVEEHPGNTRIPTEKELKVELENIKTGKPAEMTGETSPQAGSNEPAAATIPAHGMPPVTALPPASSGSGAAATAPEKVRHEWYQSQDSVVVTLYVKGISKDSVEVDLKDETASLQFPLPSGSDYAFTLDPLYAPIDPSASKVSVMGTKIELVLHKRTAGQKWSALEGSSTTPKLADRPAAPSSTAGPAYPTSSRHGAKDWDKVASNLTAKKPKDKNKSDKSEGQQASEGDGNESDGADSVDSDYGGDAVDGFFKKLYATADPDTRRAMMKSYVESQGTSLSTNWSEVAKGKVEAHPPS